MEGIRLGVCPLRPVYGTQWQNGCCPAGCNRRSKIRPVIQLLVRICDLYIDERHDSGTREQPDLLHLARVELIYVPSLQRPANGIRSRRYCRRSRSVDETVGGFYNYQILNLIWTIVIREISLC